MTERLHFHFSLSCIGEGNVKTPKESQMYRTVFWTLWERERDKFYSFAINMLYFLINQLNFLSFKINLNEYFPK